MREKLIELQMQAKIGWTKAEFADHLIANGVTIQQWIPVTERLPGDSRGVILCTRSRIVGVGFYDKHTRNWVQLYSGGGICVDVTHWMPLPEPPSGERRSDD